MDSLMGGEAGTPRHSQHDIHTAQTITGPRRGAQGFKPGQGPNASFLFADLVK